MKNKLCSIFCGLFFLWQSAFCDWVLLDNQERIQGSIVALSKKELSIVSEQFGQVQCSWQSVLSLQSDLPFLIRLKNGKHFIASFSPHEKKNMVVLFLKDGSEKELSLREIATFQLPSAAESIEDDDFQGNFSLSASDISGNTNKENVGLGADMTYRFTKDRVHDSIRMRFDFRYGELNHHINQRNGFWEFQYKGKFIKQFLWYFLEKISFNHAQDLRARFEENLGLSYPLWKKDPINFSLKLGIARTDSNYKTSPNQGEFRYSGGWELRWRIYQKVLLMQDFDYLPSSKSFSSYFLRLNHKLRVPLSYQWAFDLRHDWSCTHPALASKRENDLSSSLQLTYVF